MFARARGAAQVQGQERAALPERKGGACPLDGTPIYTTYPALEQPSESRQWGCSQQGPARRGTCRKVLQMQANPFSCHPSHLLIEVGRPEKNSSAANVLLRDSLRKLGSQDLPPGKIGKCELKP